MAQPIKETPILKGKDARAFDKEMIDAQKRKVPSEDYKRAKAIYELVKKNSSQFV
jgi:hypothetical protein